MPFASWRSSTTALDDQSSTGNVIRIDSAVAVAPMPAGKPPAKSRAVARSNGPRGSIVSCCGMAPAYNPRPMAIYLDHAATTPLRPEVLEAMLPYLTTEFGNASSAHGFGRVARAALDEAHERIATRIGAEAREIVLTSGGTEALNLGAQGRRVGRQGPRATGS